MYFNLRAELDVIKLIIFLVLEEEKFLCYIPDVSSSNSKLEEVKTSFNSENNSWEKRKSFDLR